MARRDTRELRRAARGTDQELVRRAAPRQRLPSLKPSGRAGGAVTWRVSDSWFICLFLDLSYITMYETNNRFFASQRVKCVNKVSCLLSVCLIFACGTLGRADAGRLTRYVARSRKHPARPFTQYHCSASLFATSSHIRPKICQGSSLWNSYATFCSAKHFLFEFLRFVMCGKDYEIVWNVQTIPQCGPLAR